MTSVPRRVDEHTGHTSAGRLVALWAGIFAPPLLVLVHLELSYLLVPVACRTGARWWLHLSTVVVLLVLAGVAAASWRARDTPSSPARIEGGAATGSSGRTRFMVVVGLWLAALAALTIVVSAVPVFLLDPCR